MPDSARRSRSLWTGGTSWRGDYNHWTCHIHVSWIPIFLQEQDREENGRRGVYHRFGGQVGGVGGGGGGGEEGEEEEEREGGRGEGERCGVWSGLSCGGVGRASG